MALFDYHAPSYFIKQDGKWCDGLPSLLWLLDVVDGYHTTAE